MEKTSNDENRLASHVHKNISELKISPTITCISHLTPSLPVTFLLCARVYVCEYVCVLGGGGGEGGAWYESNTV